MKNYGQVLVIYQLPYSEWFVTEAEKMVSHFEELHRSPAHWKQHDKIGRDIDMLKNYIEKAKAGACLGFVWRQYAGHKYVPNKVNNKYPILAIGSYVMWQ